VDSIYTDFPKTFDKVRYLLLWDKMSTDVVPSRCQWLGSYFSGRKESSVARDIFVTLGVP
jgi:hypothetical protein